MLTKILLYTIFIAMCSSQNTSGVPAEDLEFLRECFKDIPENDRKQVLFHHLFLGYILKNPELEPKGYNLDKNATLKVYDIFLNKFRSNQAFSTICFASGTCIDPSDSGIYP
ncbi:uncharacterized protein LOC130445927 [Diorhabda sublineata]|uniref:uncharacterized protein LOC130445927 n=1 Tax=Diorhabda sublineata TaxID=1163346 RepID=UPI0024E13F99|nr:uncharacterized protein LOC130445927 [Diorhabda sublineata]